MLLMNSQVAPTHLAIAELVSQRNRGSFIRMTAVCSEADPGGESEVINVAARSLCGIMESLSLAALRSPVGAVSSVKWVPLANRQLVHLSESLSLAREALCLTVLVLE